MKGIATNHWASLGIHHGASFVKYRGPHFDRRDPSKCRFPLKPLRPYPIKENIPLPRKDRLHRMSLREMESLLLRVYCEYMLMGKMSFGN